MAPEGITAEMYQGLAALPAFSPDGDERPPGPGAGLGARRAAAQAWHNCTSRTEFCGGHAAGFSTPRQPERERKSSRNAPQCNIRQLTDVLHCKLQQYFRRNRHRARQLRNRIDAMAPTRPTELHQRRLRLIRKPTSVAEARNQVRAVIRTWKVPVDPDIALLLTSDLVTSAITHGDGE